MMQNLPNFILVGAAIFIIAFGLGRTNGRQVTDIYLQAAIERHCVVK